MHTLILFVLSFVSFGAFAQGDEGKYLYQVTGYRVERTSGQVVRLPVSYDTMAVVTAASEGFIISERSLETGKEERSTHLMRGGSRSITVYRGSDLIEERRLPRPITALKNPGSCTTGDVVVRMLPRYLKTCRIVLIDDDGNIMKGLIGFETIAMRLNGNVETTVSVHRENNLLHVERWMTSVANRDGETIAEELAIKVIAFPFSSR